MTRITRLRRTILQLPQIFLTLERTFIPPFPSLLIDQTNFPAHTEGRDSFF